ncbi:MAG: hypothetical protein A3I05_02020 [Deltaproteobacteria bacterium RIFCSPLOWO2_02_FULL_44_10]|nr:MAG: hypothetical protein A3C46_08190 [Deltaproteobacteria bacterium RIFCSPHIGHO2_02_FULL_44_16]OGQ47557.1 MAG: hypothetical protein A3I05_02020 [Deltaproteobacteria bacterium RIFCSPLOWO2_02_FULL_44_10]
MKKPRWKTCTAEELWKYVAWHFAKHGVDTVLVGGSVVSVYTEGAYQSGDLDFVVTTYTVPNFIEILKKIGFHQQASHFVHSQCKHFFLEFVSPPLGIGNDINIKPDEHLVDGQKIKILSPTDCIRDRLASFIHFKARECLDQAVLVAKRHPHDLKKIKKWCNTEGGEEQFKEFERLLKT